MESDNVSQIDQNKTEKEVEKPKARAVGISEIMTYY